LVPRDVSSIALRLDELISKFFRSSYPKLTSAIFPKTIEEGDNDREALVRLFAFGRTSLINLVIRNLSIEVSGGKLWVSFLTIWDRFVGR
jgi:hypothetical protein